MSPLRFSHDDRTGKPSVSGPVIFDCDGVLVDSEPLSNRALAETLTELGVPMTTEESIRAFMGRSWGTVEAYLAERPGGVPSDLKERYRTRMFGAFASSLKAVSGVEAALDAVAAAGIPTCVASSGDPEKIAYTLGLTGLMPRFEGRIFSTVEVMESHDELQLTGYRISFLTDDIISLRYVEIEGELRKVLTVVKMRGSDHSREFRAYEITANGALLRESLRDYEGIITGVPTRRLRTRELTHEPG